MFWRCLIPRNDLGPGDIFDELWAGSGLVSRVYNVSMARIAAWMMMGVKMQDQGVA